MNCFFSKVADAIFMLTVVSVILLTDRIEVGCAEERRSNQRLEGEDRWDEVGCRQRSQIAWGNPDPLPTKTSRKTGRNRPVSLVRRWRIKWKSCPRCARVAWWTGFSAVRFFHWFLSLVMRRWDNIHWTVHFVTLSCQDLCHLHVSGCLSTPVVHNCDRDLFQIPIAGCRRFHNPSRLVCNVCEK